MRNIGVVPRTAARTRHSGSGDRKTPRSARTIVWRRRDPYFRRIAKTRCRHFPSETSAPNTYKTTFSARANESGTLHAWPPTSLAKWFQRVGQCRSDRGSVERSRGDVSRRRPHRLCLPRGGSTAGRRDDCPTTRRDGKRSYRGCSRFGNRYRSSQRIRESDRGSLFL